jgi:putative peptidoglycan lipid II flippase
LGVSPDLDAFLLAFALPAFLFNALNSALATAFVPAYAHVRHGYGESVARSMAGQLSWVLAICLVVVSLLSAPLLAQLIPVVARSFSDDTASLTVSILYMLMPVLVVSGISGFWSGYLNANERFAVASIAPSVTPLTVAGFLVFGWDTFGIFALVIGTNAGALIELVVIGIAASRLGLPLGGVSGFWRLIRKSVGPEFGAAAAGSLVLGATLVVDQSMAAMLEPGSIAALSYGARVPGFLAGIGVLALSTPLLPQLSRLMAAREIESVRVVIRQYALLTLAITSVSAIVLTVFSEPIVSVLFERGAFDATDTKKVASVQMAYALYIPFYAVSVIAARLVSAMQSNVVLFVGACISLVLNVVLNWYLSQLFGVVGIALATGAVYFVSCVYLWLVALRRLRLYSQAPEQRI